MICNLEVFALLGTILHKLLLLKKNLRLKMTDIIFFCSEMVQMTRKVIVIMIGFLHSQANRYTVHLYLAVIYVYV